MGSELFYFTSYPSPHYLWSPPFPPQARDSEQYKGRHSAHLPMRKGQQNLFYSRHTHTNKYQQFPRDRSMYRGGAEFLLGLGAQDPAMLAGTAGKG